MTIASLDRAEGRRTDMGKEKGRFNLTGNADEVLVIPSRKDVSKEAGLFAFAVPTKAAPVRICRRDRVSRAQTLIDQRRAAARELRDRLAVRNRQSNGT